MKKFLIKILIFLLPWIITNFVLLKAGYFFSSKSEFVLIHNLKSYEPGKFNIKFYGTSRIENDISPDEVEKGFNENTYGKKARVFNCGMNTEMTGWGLRMQEKYFARCDLMVIEIYPGKNPMQSLNNPVGNISPSSYIDQLLSFHVNHYIVFQNLSNFISDLRDRLPVKYMRSNKNGWTELIYVHRKTRLDRIKTMFALWAEDDMKRKEYSQGWDIFAGKLKELQVRSKCGIAFIRMPVQGRVKELNDSIINQFDPMSYLRLEFPGSLFIDANHMQTFKNLATIDDSHLESPSAKIFSRKLGQLLSVQAPGI
jgi:hypothetical protein